MTMISTSSDCSYGQIFSSLIGPEAMGRLDLLLESTLSVLSQINRSNIGVSLLEPDGPIAHIFAYQDVRVKYTSRS
jgi:hypothetical protein